MRFETWSVYSIWWCWAVSGSARLTGRYIVRMRMPLSSAPFREAPPSDAVSRTVNSFDGTRIQYDLYEAPSRTAVVIVPGFWRYRRHPSMTHLALWLQSEGYRTAVVDPRGHGDSEGTYGFNLNEHYDV